MSTTSERNPLPQGGKADKVVITLLDAANAFESLMWGDPGITREEVTEMYVNAESDARAREAEGRVSFSRLPETIDRLKMLGIDPETLKPASDSPEK